MGNYSRLELQGLALEAFESVRGVFKGELEGRFKGESLHEISNFLTNFDFAAFYEESKSYGQNDLDEIERACIDWLACLWGVDSSQLTNLSLPKILSYFNEPPEPMKRRGELVLDVDDDDIISDKSNGNDHWLLTDDGYLEFYGGGWLHNSYGEVIDGKNPIGSEGIQTGLQVILNRALSEGQSYNDDAVIELMQQSGLNFRTTNHDSLEDKSSWQWDLWNNLNENENRRIRLPDEVVEYYKQFEHQAEARILRSGLIPVEGGIITTQFDGIIGGHRHKGIDVSSPMNRRLQASKDGVIIYSGQDPRRNGNYGLNPSFERTEALDLANNQNPKGAAGVGFLTVTQNDDGTMSFYGHSLSPQVNTIGGFEFRPVSAGDDIGGYYDIGYSAGAHVHYVLVQVSNRGGGPVFFDPSNLPAELMQRILEVTGHEDYEGEKTFEILGYNVKVLQPTFEE